MCSTGMPASAYGLVSISCPAAIVTKSFGKAQVGVGSGHVQSTRHRILCIPFHAETIQHQELSIGFSSSRWPDMNKVLQLQRI